MFFGISSAPEEYQRRQDQTVEGLPGVRSIIDDILIYGEGDTEEEAIADHDVKFRALMERCKERNLKLNKDKLSLKMKEVKFIGHLIMSKGLKPDPEKVCAMFDPVFSGTPLEPMKCQKASGANDSVQTEY
jgi:hypothetical protein